MIFYNYHLEWAVATKAAEKQKLISLHRMLNTMDQWLKYLKKQMLRTLIQTTKYNDNPLQSATKEF